MKKICEGCRFWESELEKCQRSPEDAYHMWSDTRGEFQRKQEEQNLKEMLRENLDKVPVKKSLLLEMRTWVNDVRNAEDEFDWRNLKMDTKELINEINKVLSERR